MPKLPAFLAENKVLTIILFSVIGVILILLLIIYVPWPDFSQLFGQRETTPAVEKATPTPVATLPSPGMLENQTAAENILEFFDNTLNEEGLYASNLECQLDDATRNDQFAVAKNCRPLNNNPLGGFALMWGRFQAYKTFGNQLDLAFLTEDLNNYYTALTRDASASSTLNLTDISVPVCTYLHEIQNSPILTETSRAQANALCLASNYATPSASLENNMDARLDFLIEKTLQNQSAEIIAQIPYGLANASNLAPRTACKASLLASLLQGRNTTDNQSLRAFLYEFSHTQELSANVELGDTAALAACALAMPDFDQYQSSPALLRDKIANVHQNQAEKFNLKTAPYPFITSTANGGDTWLIDVAQNGALVGGLSLGTY